MALNSVAIANMALGHLGKDGITAMNDNSAEGRACNFWFDISAREALTGSTWTFARKLAVLAELTNDFAERWVYKYDEPADALTIVRVVASYDPRGDVPVDMERMNGFIYTNVSPASVDYVFDNLTTTSWSPQFDMAVSFLLARNMSMQLTRKRQLFTDMDALWRDSKSKAVEHDAGQQPTYWGYESAYLIARNGGSDAPDAAAPDGSIYWT